MQRLADIALRRELPNDHVVGLLDYFEHKTQNGTHLVLVQELMWRDVLGFLQGYTDCEAEIRIPVAQKISKQLILGVDFLQKCGLMHNGDLVLNHV